MSCSRVVRSKVRKLTGRRRWAGMKDSDEVIELLNPLLRGRGKYYRTGNASLKFSQADRFVREWLVRLLATRGGK